MNQPNIIYHRSSLNWWKFKPWPEPALVIFMDFLIIISRKPSCLSSCSFFHCLLFQIFNDFEGEVHYIPSLGVLLF